MRKKYFTYKNGGSIWETKARLDKVKKARYCRRKFPDLHCTIKDMLCSIRDDLNESYADIETNNLSISYYGYDERIGYDVYIICVDKWGKEDFIKECGCPQFVRFMVEL